MEMSTWLFPRFLVVKYLIMYFATIYTYSCVYIYFWTSSDSQPINELRFNLQLLTVCGASKFLNLNID